MKKANNREVVTTKRCKNNPTRVFVVEIDADVMDLVNKILAKRQSQVAPGYRVYLKNLYKDAALLGMRTILHNAHGLVPRKNRKNIHLVGFEIPTDLFYKYQHVQNELSKRTGIFFHQGIILEFGLRQLYAKEVGKRWWQFWK